MNRAWLPAPPDTHPSLHGHSTCQDFLYHSRDCLSINKHELPSFFFFAQKIAYHMRLPEHTLLYIHSAIFFEVFPPSAHRDRLHCISWYRCAEFIQPSTIDEHLGRFQNFVIINNSATNTLVHARECIHRRSQAHDLHCKDGETEA